MKRIKVDACVCRLKLRDHHKIKDRVLSDIDRSFSESLSPSNSYIDSVSKLDWSQSKDFERSWTKIFLPSFHITMKEFLAGSGYKDEKNVQLNDVWYQQYLEGDSHGWHVHSDHFTGVYYLEYPRGCSKTEICSPYSLKTKKIDASEGDIIVFPSHWIHRGPSNKSKNRKTIISFNFNLPIMDGGNINSKMIGR